MTNPHGPYHRFSTQHIQSPYFSGLDTLFGATIEFDHKYALGNTGAGQISFLDTAGIGQKIDLPVQGWPLNGNFIGSSIGWVHSSFPLDLLSIGPLTQFEFSMNIFGLPLDGWAIDNFEIAVPPQNSASPLNLEFVSGLPQQTGNSLKISIRNTGAAPLSSTTVFIEENGNLKFTAPIVFSPPLPAGQARKVSPAGSLNLSQGTSNLMVYTQQPNSRADNIPNDDTLQIPITVLRSVSNFPYCANFENSPEFLSFNTVTNQIDTLWKNGIPNKGNVSGTHAGSGAWHITPSGAASVLADDYLFTPEFQVSGGQCYRFSFWHLFDTEKNLDGGNVEISLDSGNTWQVFGSFGDTAWYNTLFIQALDAVKPGFSGSANGWSQSFKDFKLPQSGTVQFRFRYATSASVESDGWAIDDVCLETVSGGCGPVSLEEISAEGGFAIFPNPAENALTLRFAKADAKDIFVTDALGKIILQKSVAEKETALDVSGLAAGFYAIIVKDSDGRRAARSFVKK